MNAKFDANIVVDFYCFQCSHVVTCGQYSHVVNCGNYFNCKYFGINFDPCLVLTKLYQTIFSSYLLVQNTGCTSTA